jgi:CubicO group peptidase (beta-lactamase class C family)
MTKKALLFFHLWLLFTFSFSQNMAHFADSIRKVYHIPELNYAVISSEKVLEIQALGTKKVRSERKASLEDKFRIGSNTKTITAYIAAILVKKGQIKWETHFFDLFPELKTQSDSAHYQMTLQDLITFRVNLMSWTYTNKLPKKKEIQGSEAEQPYLFLAWVLRQKPNDEVKTVYWSNPSYVAAALMLEKASGKSYKTLVKEFGDSLDIHFDFGQPIYKDKNQPYGHNWALKPEKRGESYKLNWLCAAGNVYVSLPDYAKFIQMQLQGLAGKSPIFSQTEFQFFHYGLPKFAFGWNNDLIINDLQYSFHKGNPGTFISKVYICAKADKAFLFFMNVQSEEAEKGLEILFEALNQKYLPSH